jgi:LPXTG-site transpeptidase (sortase) family protein
MALWSIGWVPADVEELGSRALASVFESGRASVKDALEDPSGLLANSLEGTAAPQERGAPAVSPEASIEEPIRLRIASLGIDSVVLNPESRDTAVLDRALLSGVVHYPGSGNLDDVSNMFLFGHSTRLREVRNRSFAVFNRLPELRLGDEIEVDGLMATYRYRVISIKEAPADEALVRFERGRKRLTLSTCTTFGARENRIMVEADFVSSTPRPF